MDKTCGECSFSVFDGHGLIRCSAGMGTRWARDVQCSPMAIADRYKTDARILRARVDRMVELIENFATDLEVSPHTVLVAKEIRKRLAVLREEDVKMPWRKKKPKLELDRDAMAEFVRKQMEKEQMDEALLSEATDIPKKDIAKLLAAKLDPSLELTANLSVALKFSLEELVVLKGRF